jgi:ATP-binding cassette subfamily F protein uup
VALAQALVGEPQLLLLDEPTNHLDVDGILWLEDLLCGYAGAIIVITHDRVFLDGVATRIVELDRGKLVSFPGRFAAYQERKEFMLGEEALANARADKLLAQEEVWIRKGVEARRTRSVGRVARWSACAASARRGASSRGRSTSASCAARPPASWWRSWKTSPSDFRHGGASPSCAISPAASCAATRSA